MNATTNSQRPYLLRAMHEWMTDNGHTPHIVVDADAPGVDVPGEHVADGKIILNLSYAAVHNLELGNDCIACEARFAGRPRRLVIPVGAVLGIYARETGRGMIFATEEPAAASPTGDAPADTGPPAGTDGGRSHLKVVK